MTSLFVLSVLWVGVIDQLDAGWVSIELIDADGTIRFGAASLELFDAQPVEGARVYLRMDAGDCPVVSDLGSTPLYLPSSLFDETHRTVEFSLNKPGSSAPHGDKICPKLLENSVKKPSNQPSRGLINASEKAL